MEALLFHHSILWARRRINLIPKECVSKPVSISVSNILSQPLESCTGTLTMSKIPTLHTSHLYNCLFDRNQKISIFGNGHFQKISFFGKGKGGRSSANERLRFYAPLCIYIICFYTAADQHKSDLKRFSSIRPQVNKKLLQAKIQASTGISTTATARTSNQNGFNYSQNLLFRNS